MVRYILHVATDGFRRNEKIWKDEDGLATEVMVSSSAPPIETAKLHELYPGAQF